MTGIGQDYMERAAAKFAQFTPGSSGEGLAKPMPKKEPSISVSLTVLEKTISAAAEDLQVLRDRLSPVLNGEAAQAGGGLREPVAGSCPMDECIQDLTSRVQALGFVIRALTNALEV